MQPDVAAGAGGTRPEPEEELGKEARTWPETQVMHRKKTSALFPEWAFYHRNKTRFFLLKERSALLKTRFYGHFVNYSCR